MPKLLAFMLLAIAAIVAASPVTARDYPFCIKGCDFGSGRGDCSFSSLSQCQATASGLAATCVQNPYFAAKGEWQSERSLPHARK
jgi:uncharacterized protein DUF3551